MTEWDGSWADPPESPEQLMARIRQERQAAHQRIENEWQTRFKNLLRKGNILRWVVLGTNLLAASMPLLKEPSWFYLQIPFNLGLGCYFFYTLTKQRKQMIRDETARRLSGKSILGEGWP